ncbi:hypothetical protein P7C71_g3472, partial [Lecanoromycetidae sp. Uapishka_2]
MRSLPQKWTDPWFDLTLEWGWKRRYEPFKRFGSDTFITVSPERNVLYTADPDVISQITTRRNDFPKALEVYESLKIYGNNVVTSEGQLWRHHRKIVSPPFTEKNNHLVWAETLDQTRAMLNSWLDGGPTIYTIADDAMRLSLHVISRAGFGVHLQWPGQEKRHENGHAKGSGNNVSDAIPAGHKMSYTDALGLLLHNILTVLIVPRFLLNNDLEEFKPERWLLDANAKTGVNMPDQNGDTEASNLGVNTAADTSAALYHPPKGAYIPFSEGYRSCIGRRFAQVEILAVIALIFTQYSVELAVDKFATDEEVNNMDEKAKRGIWGKARDEVERQMREDMAAIITLQLRKGSIGLRLVKRGEEKFDFK